MSEDSGSEQAPVWAPEEVEALYEAAQRARDMAQWAVEASREAMWRREDAHIRYMRMVAEMQLAWEKRG